MFSDEELEYYNKMFLSLGINDREAQKEMLGFLFTLGTIAHKQINFI